MPVWISHRGVCDSKTVENSRESFAAAVRKGFKVLETDLRLTADHHIVLAHDEDFNRLCSDARPIIKVTRAQIEALQFSDGQSPFFLDQFLDEFPKQAWIFDLKNPLAQASAAILRRMVLERMSMADFVKKASFVAWSKLDEFYLIEAFPGARIFAREPECWRAGLSMMYLGGFAAGITKDKVYSLPPEVHGRKLFTREMVQKYHAHGARLIAFLPRTEAEAREAVNAGFDEILSDGWIVK